MSLLSAKSARRLALTPLTGALALACATPLSFAADSAADAPVLQETVVKATAVSESATGPINGYHATRSSTATRTDTPLNEVAQSITVIGADQIRDQNAQTMQETLRYTAGVNADAYGLDNRGDWFDLRGGSEGSTLLDGMRLMLAGNYGDVRNEPYSFERVEVLRGPASVMSGQNGPGGVVNIVSKRPLAEAQHEIALQYGNHDHKQLAIDSTGPLTQDGTVLYRVVGLLRDAGTQVEHADEERQLIAPSITFKPNERVSFTAYAEYQNDRSGNTDGFFPIAGTLNEAPNGRIPEDTFVGEPSFDEYGGVRTRVGYEFNYTFNDTWRISQNTRHDAVNGKMRSMYANFWEVDRQGNGYGSDALGANRTLNRTWYAADDNSGVTTANAVAVGKFAWGATQHTVMAGVDAMRSNNTSTSWSGDATALDVYAPVYGTFDLPDLRSTPGYTATTHVNDYGVFAQDQIKFQQWVATVGVRHDKATTTVDTSSGGNSDSGAWSKNVGVVYLAPAGLSPYLSYSESFEPVTGTDAHGAAFVPKRGKQVEAGVKWVANAQFGASAAVYKMKEKNRLTTDPDNINYSVQAGEITTEGVELEATGNLGNWDAVGSYTFTRARTTASSDPSDATLDKHVANVPENMVKLWAAYRFTGFGLPRLRVGGGMRFTGVTYDGTDQLKIPSYTLFDAMASYNAGNFTYALNASNLFDRTWIASCGTRGDCWYGTRRKVIGTVSYNW
ncbi:TonB-dependent siderophore receptor [Amantichitinum ursilacus]|uniref:Ferrichrome-iron receptor n=1 Tax=Amantichitinum ursilacus TaxID=857265 RepID=A0A0N0GQ33_9NEIS|nr:TonB-dependent siderophore receptor [Amantichitinum ursilacus]KPC54252.1 Ferrichrome-iron receptor precursor [Amantichitinum ursilacus]